MFVQDCLQLGIAAQKMWDKGLFVFDYCLSVINKNFLSLNIVASLNRKKICTTKQHQKRAQQNCNTIRKIFFFTYSFLLQIIYDCPYANVSISVEDRKGGGQRDLLNPSWSPGSLTKGSNVTRSRAGTGNQWACSRSYLKTKICLRLLLGHILVLS